MAEYLDSKSSSLSLPSSFLSFLWKVKPTSLFFLPISTVLYLNHLQVVFLFSSSFYSINREIEFQCPNFLIALHDYQSMKMSSLLHGLCLIFSFSKLAFSNPFGFGIGISMGVQFRAMLAVSMLLSFILDCDISR